MTTYELVIREHQPTCGGKEPMKATIQTVTIEDPVEYVKSLEQGSELEVSQAEDGTLTISTTRNGYEVSYEFAED